jgi:ubiquinone/menaquinone biosynthesis C-methylase UbiE
LERVEDFYDRNPQYEWFALTMRALEDYLPQPPAEILDVGGGPGRYAIELARRGYEVILFDLSRGCLEFAAEKAKEAGAELASYEYGNATDLSRFEDEKFHAVLLMGPLYHLLREGERRRAIREAKRVLRPAGVIFAAFITYYAPIRWAAKYEPEWIIEHQGRLGQLLTSGTLRARPDHGFTDAYFIHPSEVQPLMEGEGFQTLDLIACEGVISMIEEKINELSGEPWERWVELNYLLGKDLSVHGTAEHLLYVGRRH